ncbi:MAG TPA: SprB repeat-containing protein [Chitinophagaceae bacterium]
MDRILHRLPNSKCKLIFLLFAINICAHSVMAQCGLTISTSITNVTCYNGTNGSVTVTVSGGTAPYQYQLAEGGAGAWSSTNTFTGLAAATYPLSVKDNTGCIQTIYITITQPPAIAINYTATDVTCTGGSNGSITINVSGGTSPYTYNWTKNGLAFSTTANLTNLLPANYNLVVTDAAGCTDAPIILQEIKSIGLTGFNEDVVANGINTTPASVTSQAFDDGNGAVLYEEGYTNASAVTSTPGGLPAGGSFTSIQNSSRPYQLASYTGNNSLLLRSSSATTYGGSVSGTLTFQTQFKSTYSILYVLGSTGSGTGTVDYTVHFADGTTATGQLTFADWYNTAASTQNAILLKRVERTTGVFDSRYNFNLFEVPITIPGADQSKVINSIDFSWANAGSARINLMAITGYTSTTSGIRIDDGTSATVTPSVSVASNAASNTFCTGQNITFTATPTNGGAGPVYQWKLNNVNTGTNSPTYSNSGLNNNDQVEVVMTSNLACVSTTTASSNTLVMTNGTATASVSISASTTNTCSGTTVNFTATPTNGGTAPSYQWKRNNVNVGTNSPTYSTSGLSNNDQIKVVMTSSIGCALSNPATSNTITMSITNNATPTITVTSNPAFPYNGFPVMFTSTITYGGASPGYQWYKNGNTISGATLPFLSVVNPVTTEKYSVKLTSSYSCSTSPYAMSNYIDVSSTLPVSLEWFETKPVSGKALLQWKMSQEINNKQFIIERTLASEPSSFKVVGNVASSSATGAVYKFTNDPGHSGIYLYRLMQEDIDGQKRSLGIRKINLNGKNSWTIQNIGSIWKLNCTQAFIYQLIDMQGRILEHNSASGNIDIPKPPCNGIYLLQLNIGGESYIQKLLK